jgi:arabinofuranosyltransferase
MSARTPIWVHGPLLLLLAVQAPLIVSWGSFDIHGERYFALAEDPMISMRYARNLADGAGLVWNPGERVEGYTNPLWTLYMAAVHATGLEDRLTSLAVMGTNVLINGLCLLVLAQLVATVGGRAATVAAAGILYALALYPALYAVSGMEHTLQTLFVLLGSWSILRDHRTGRSRVQTFVWIGLPAVVRADGLAFTAVLAAAAAWRNGWRPALRNLFVVVAPFAGWLAFRVGYYHDLFPNTYYLKMQMPLELRLENGIAYCARFLREQAPLLAVLAAGQCFARPRNRDVSLLLAICVGFLAVAAWEGGTITGPRLLMPAYALLVAAVVLCLQQLADTVVDRWESRIPSTSERSRLRRGALVSSGGLVLLWATPHLGPEEIERFKGWQRWRGYVEMALAIKANTRPDAKIALTGAGIIPYFSRRPTVDMLGVSDRHIARLPATGGRLAGHNKMDFDWSLGHLAPDLVVSHFNAHASRADLERAARGDHAYHARLRLNPFFRELYEPNLVPLSAREHARDPQWAYLYVRADSPELLAIDQWRFP